MLDFRAAIVSAYVRITFVPQVKQVRSVTTCDPVLENLMIGVKHKKRVSSTHLQEQTTFMTARQNVDGVIH